MGDTSNWEFAAVVAAVVMGLGGLLVFTIISSLGSWRLFRLAAQASSEAAAASEAVQGLARQLAASHAVAADVPLPPAEVSELLQEADALIEQQGRLQDATRRLIDARARHGSASGESLDELDAAMRRLDENLRRVAAAVANLGSRTT
ncbi:MAG: hypothetical protein IVW36_10980 [Dehalococcoidia bacterium]|nr:hypothetical protein [Dehalococcoidia bacterium]